MRTMVLLAVVAAAVLLPAAGVLAESAADEAMAQQIGSQLKNSGLLHDYRIGVKYHDGVAWLAGSVASPQQRDAAVRLTNGLDGVAHVICELEVAGESKGRQLANRNDAAEYADTQPSDVVPAAAVTYGDMRAERYAQSARAPQRMPARRAYNTRSGQSNMPRPSQRMAARPAVAYAPQPAGPYYEGDVPGGMGPAPAAYVPGGQARAVSYDNAQMPGYAWPSYSAYPNYAALTYPRQYSPAAWPYIGPFYPYPQVPLGWRKVALEWDDGWWFLDFSSCGSSH